jgi:hypothetical protein
MPKNYTNASRNKQRDNKQSICPSQSQSGPKVSLVSPVFAFSDKDTFACQLYGFTSMTSCANTSGAEVIAPNITSTHVTNAGCKNLPHISMFPEAYRPQWVKQLRTPINHNCYEPIKFVALRKHVAIESTMSRPRSTLVSLHTTPSITATHVAYAVHFFVAKTITAIAVLNTAANQSKIVCWYGPISMLSIVQLMRWWVTTITWCGMFSGNWVFNTKLNSRRRNAHFYWLFFRLELYATRYLVNKTQ